jgi:hypothetical protein
MGARLDAAVQMRLPQTSGGGPNFHRAVLGQQQPAQGGPIGYVDAHPHALNQRGCCKVPACCRSGPG